MHGEADDRVTVDLLADLQAGLLDDATASRLRRRARTEPDVTDALAALDRVRRDVAALGTDPASATEVPTDVTESIRSALRAAPAPPPRRWRRRGLVATVLVAFAMGAVAWLAGDHAHRAPDPPAPAPAQVDGVTDIP